MGKRRSTPKVTTPPKGRPTPPRRSGRPAGRGRWAMLGWIGVAAAIAALIGFAIWIGSDQQPRPLGSPAYESPVLASPALAA